MDDIVPNYLTSVEFFGDSMDSYVSVSAKRCWFRCTIGILSRSLTFRRVYEVCQE